VALPVVVLARYPCPGGVGARPGTSQRVSRPEGPARAGGGLAPTPATLPVGQGLRSGVLVATGPAVPAPAGGVFRRGDLVDVPTPGLKL